MQEGLVTPSSNGWITSHRVHFRWVITNAATFVNAGYSTLTTDGAPNGSPSLIQSNFANKNIPAAQMAAGSVSGWIWNEGQIVSSGSLGTAKEYAQAIINGLNQL